MISVTSYGAIGDGRIVTDGVISSADPSLLTSAAALFSSADVGKKISLVNMGEAGAALTTTIASYIAPDQISPAQVRLASAYSGNAVVKVVILGDPVVGQFTLSLGGSTTPPIDVLAGAATIQSSIEGLSTVGPGNVLVKGASDGLRVLPFYIEFKGAIENQNVGPVTVAPVGAAFSVTVKVLRDGGLTPQANVTVVYGTDDLNHFNAALAACPDGGTVLVPLQPGAFYWVNAQGPGVCLNITKGVTLLGEAGAKLKYGPEGPSTPDPVTGSAWCMINHEAPGKTVTVDNLILEGPEDNHSTMNRATFQSAIPSRFALRRVATTKFGMLLATENSASTDQQETYIDSCDVHCADNGVGQSSVLIRQYGVVFVSESKFVNSTDVSGKNGLGYHFYLFESASFHFDRCYFGDSGGFAIANHGSAPGFPPAEARFAVVNDCIFNGAWGGPYETCEAVETKGLITTQITDCQFIGTGHGIRVRGNLVVANCLFSNLLAGGIAACVVASGSDGTYAIWDTCTFVNALLVYQNTSGTSGLWKVTNCNFDGSNLPEIVVSYHAGGTLRLTNCNFKIKSGFPNRAVTAYKGITECRDCRFENSAGSQGVRATGFTDQSVGFIECYWTDGANAFQIDGINTGDCYLNPRRMTNPMQVASAPGILLNPNFDSHTISGRARVDSLSYYDGATTANLSTSPVRFVPMGPAGDTLGFAFTSAGNINAAPGRRPIDRAVLLALHKYHSRKWIQVV